MQRAVFIDLEKIGDEQRLNDVWGRALANNCGKSDNIVWDFDNNRVD